MPKVILANDNFYHVFNRGTARQPTFTSKWEYKRGIATIDYYRFENPPRSLSKVLQLNQDDKETLLTKLRNHSNKLVEVIAYCLMNNHFHLLLKQIQDNGISKYVSQLTNSYTRYFNSRRKDRIGPIFQGTFKAIRIEDENQLVHVNRYIHINPTVSLVVKESELETYPWSSLPEYLGKSDISICNKEPVMSHFSSVAKYREFIFDQIDYAKKLKEIKHLTLEVPS